MNTINDIIKFTNKRKNSILKITIVTIIVLAGLAYLFLSKGYLEPYQVGIIGQSIFFIIVMISIYIRYRNLRKNDLLIKYYGDKTKYRDYAKEELIYACNYHTLCDHIYISKNHLIIVNNDVKIIPIDLIKSIYFVQNKGIINSTESKDPTQWQNTAMMTSWRGLPNTVYCYYDVKIKLNLKEEKKGLYDDIIITSKLIKETGNQVYKCIKEKLNLEIELTQISNFNDDKEIQEGIDQSIKVLLPAILLILATIILLLI